MAKSNNLRLMAVVVLVILIGTGSVWADLTDGLIAHWKFDGDANDSAGSNDGTLVNGPTWTTGQFDGALQFDGVDDYVDLGNDNSLKPPLPVTISAWIKCPSSDSYGQIIGLDDQSSRYYGIWIHTGAGGIAVGYGDGGTPGPYSRRSKGGGGTLEADVWYHITTVVTDAIDMDIYINGINAGGTYNGTGGNLTYSNGNSSIGSRLGLSSEFNGAIDDVRVYDRALSAEEIGEIYSEGAPELVWLEIAGPNQIGDQRPVQYKAIAHYDNNSTKDVTDLADWLAEPNTICDIDNSGLLTTQHIFTLQENAAIYAQYTEYSDSVAAQKDIQILPICSSGTSLNFDGGNDCVRVPDSNNFTTATATVSAWIKMNSWGGHNYGRIICHLTGYARFGNAKGFEIILNIVPNGFSYSSYNGSNWDFLPSEGNCLSLNQWSHISIVCNGAAMIAYVNGVQSGNSVPQTINPGNPSTSFIIGNHRDLIRGFDGLIDGVCFYNRALSIGEIQTLMIAGPVDDSNVIAYWDFDEGEGDIANDMSSNENHGTVIGAQWSDDVSPTGVCTLEGIVERNLSISLDIKADILGLLTDALVREQTALDILNTAFKDRDFGDVDKQDVVKSKQDIHSAMQHEVQAETSIVRSIGKLEDALTVLDIEIPPDNPPVPPGPETIMMADINVDGVVDLQDFAVMANQWLSAANPQ